jgi:hypothetical protein
MKAAGDTSNTTTTQTEGLFARRGTVGAIVAGLLVTHAGLLAYSAYKHSPTWDEYGHLVAGISHWEFGRFDLYRVNPPLVRTFAAIPVLIAGIETDWSQYYVRDGARPERQIRDDFLRVNGPRVFWLITLARWASIPFSVLGGWGCYLFASKLFGTKPGLLAAALWCFCPNILGHGQLMTPDVGAAAVGIAAHYAFWRYLCSPSTPRAFGCGTLLGLTLLTKSTWIVLPPIWIAFWLIWWWRQRRMPHRSASPLPPASNDKGSLSPLPARWGARLKVERDHTAVSARPRWRELLVVALVSWYVLNLGYLFEGSFTRLGDYGFISRTFGGKATLFPDQALPRNPYRDTWLGFVPLPLPKNFVAGIDIQKWDLERKMWSYLAGEWKRGGWWYYYLYAMAIKVPLGIWGIGVLALRSRIWDLGIGISGKVRRERGPNPQWLEELFLLAPAIAVLVLVSSQTGFNHHMRYVLPAFPFLFVWFSQAAISRRSTDKTAEPEGSGKQSVESAQPNRMCTGSQLSMLRTYLRPALVLVLLGWLIGSSLFVYPDSLSYFNESIGGPAAGGRYLHHSNVDWGQDLCYLKHWYQQNPQARPLMIAYDLTFVPLDLAGIDATRPPIDVRSPDAPARPIPDELGPVPGWYVVSVNQLNHQRSRYNYLSSFEPVDRIRHSMNVYHITLEEANRVRRRVGLPTLAP